MIRLLLFFALLAAMSFAASWLVDNEGSITIEWLGYQIETGIAFTAFTLFSLLIIAVFVVESLLWLANMPRRIAKRHAEKKKEKGMQYLTEGFAAIAAEDANLARRLAIRTEHTLGNVPLSQLLAAQAASLSNNNDEIKQHYNSLLEHKETELIALRGLLLQAKKEHNTEEAIQLAKRTVNLHPSVKWAHQTLIELYKQNHQWEHAQDAMEDALNKNVLDLASSKRASALLYLIRSVKAMSQHNMNEALLYAKEAYKLSPDLPPIITQLANVYIQQNNSSKAAKTIENNWKNAPHPELMECYFDIYSDEKPEKLLKRIEKLTACNPDNFYSHIFIARAAIPAKSYSQARNHLKIALGQAETKTVCYLMAELEREENDNPDAVQRWNERAAVAENDHMWHCEQCGYVTEYWNVTCQHCKSFDTLQWQNETHFSLNADNIGAKSLAVV